MRHNALEINASNLNDYLGLDIVAFHWAVPGACGEHGGVVFVTSDGNIYHTNYVYPEYGITEEDLCKIFPPLSDCHPGVFGGGLFPDEWKGQHLGLGNYLVVHKSLWEDFCSLSEQEFFRMKAEGKNVILYNLWHSVILKVLKNKPEHISVGAREKDV